MIDDWIKEHRDVIEQMVAHLDLPNDLVDLAFELWDKTRIKAPRIPKSLIVDCIYIVAHMTGNRRSVNEMKDTALAIIHRKTKPFNQDKRKEKTSWVETEWAKELILSVIPDDSAFDLFLKR